MEQKETYNSLYEYISAKAKPFLKDGGEMDFTISEDFKDNESNGIPFADGAYDGIAVYHMGTQGLSDETRELMINALKIASTGDKEAADRAFTELGKAQRAIHVIDPLQDYIIEHKDEIPAKRLYEFAVYAITRSCDIECVKFGLSILELLVIDENEELKDVISMLGFSEEFALFALFVMLRWSDGNDRIFRLARKTHGWGRIHAIERLEADDDRKRKWLLRNGVHNTVMPSYSALSCWNKSGASELLFGDEELSDEDARGLRDIIDALLDEGPCSGISEIENSNDALLKFLEKARFSDITDFEVVRNILNYNNEDNEQSSNKIDEKCREILDSEKCREAALQAVQEGKSIDLALSLGIDCRDDILKILESDFDNNAHLCRYLMDDKSYREKALDLFRGKLPLEAMKAAPSDQLCLGREFGNEHNLTFLIQELKPFPLEGADLLEIALQCAPPQNRNMALRVLGEWTGATGDPLQKLLPEMFALLKGLVENEPNERTRVRMTELINGELGDK
ncbi:MAG: hypothetical protein K2J77_09065 [Oscillospiraceae bacterium]|nr:hypothetical protein [Oscillospiraceae bacterium]